MYLKYNIKIVSWQNIMVFVALYKLYDPLYELKSKITIMPAMHIIHVVHVRLVYILVHNWQHFSAHV